MTETEWIEIGQKNGWASLTFDWLQSGPELSDHELDLIEDGQEPEIMCVRLYVNGAE